MKITTQDICEFATTTPSSKSFIGGENLINNGHIISCGKAQSSTSTDGVIEIISFCLQTSQLRSDPHEITGKFSNEGRIIEMQYTYKAGLGDACKHIVAVLLYCNRHDLEMLQVITCTDEKCVWNEPHKAALEKYEVQPLDQHPCFLERKNKYYEKKKNQKKNRENMSTQWEGQEELFRDIMHQSTPSSALTKHLIGRHEPIEKCNNNSVAINPDTVTAIFDNQKTSELLHSLREYAVTPVQECCSRILTRLERDVHSICTETTELHSVWKNERQLRITGSDAHSLFTYRNNKQPDWKKKSLNYFYPKGFSNCFTKHGLDTEPLAREAYEKSVSMKVVECGLIVSEDNPWLGYSPDGIVFKNDKPSKLIEIKCPCEGRKKPMSEVIKSIKWCTVQDNQICLKRRHSYYTQVQLGIAVLNLKSTDFIIYTPFDKGLLVFTVDFEEGYARDLLQSLKIIYFGRMIHNICETEATNAENKSET